MSKKHILTIGYQDYATDDVTAATKIIGLMAKLQPVKFTYEGGKGCYQPDLERRTDLKLEMSQPFEDPSKKPAVKAPKPLALPKPKRGSILCICEKSFVAPRETCPHCGRDFSESHNRTHGADRQHGEHLRLL